jgi:hypothetical protein
VAFSTSARTEAPTVAAFCSVSGTSSRSNTRCEKKDTAANAITTHTMITPARRQ